MENKMSKYIYFTALFGGIILLVLGILSTADTYIKSSSDIQYKNYINDSVDGCMETARSLTEGVFDRNVYTFCLRDKGLVSVIE